MFKCNVLLYKQSQGCAVAGNTLNCACTSVSKLVLMLPQAAHEAFEGSKAAAGSAWHSDAAHKATNKAKVSRCRPHFGIDCSIAALLTMFRDSEGGVAVP